MAPTPVQATPLPTSLGTVAQVADVLGVSELTVRRRIADGTIVAYRMGPKLLRIDMSSVARLMQRVPTTPTTGDVR